MADAFCNSMMIVVLPLHLAGLSPKDLPLPVETAASLVLSVFGFVIALIQPLAGRMADRKQSYRRFVEMGLMVLTLSTAAFLTAPGFMGTLLLRLVQGTGLGLTIPATMALVTLHSTRENRGTAMGVFTSFRMSGFAFGPLAAGLIHDRWGPSPVFALGAAASLLSIGLVRMWVPDDASRRLAKPEIPVLEGEGETPVVDLSAPASEDDDSKDLSPRESIWRLRLLGAAFFVMMIGLASLASVQTQINQRLNQGATEFGIAFSALVITRVLLQIPIGALSDRFGRLPFVVGGLILLGPATMAIGIVTATWQLVAVRMLQGAASAAVMTPGMALASDLARHGSLGAELSITTTSFSLGVAMGMLISGVLTPAIGFQPTFLVVGSLAPLAGIALWQVMSRSLDGS